MSLTDIHVHIGEVKVARGHETLNALLGSCIGVGFLWPSRKIYGLAHCLLAESPEKTFSIGGRYVDQAINSLFELMEITGKNFAEIQAVVAGGGNMTMPEDTAPEKLVGYINSTVAIKVLNERKIKVIHQDIGGILGRKIHINCQTGAFQIKKFPRTNVVAA